MSLGTRIVKRGRFSAFAHLASTPREPLLFLYPTWARNYSSATIRPASIPIPSVTPTYANSNFATETLNRGVKKEAKKSAGKTRDVATEGEQRHAKDPCHMVDDYHTVGRDEHTASLGDDAKTSNVDDTSQSKFLIRRPLSTPAYERAPAPLVRKLYQNTEKIREFEASQHARRQAYLSREREKRGSWDPDWRVILSTLSDNTPKAGKWLDEALEVIVPDEVVKKFYNGADTNLWKLGERYDCEITLGDRDVEKEVHRNFLLSGSPWAIKSTTLDILRIAPDAKLRSTRKNSVLANADSESTLLDDDVETHGRSFNIQRNRNWEIDVPVQILRADKVPRPAEWSQRSFLKYITHLTLMNMPNHMHRVLYLSGEVHRELVADILRKTFDDPNCKSSFSRDAFNQAMWYLLYSNSIENVRHLFAKMEATDIEPDVETFNIMLQQAAKVDDLHNFHFILHLMLRRGIFPNAKTWVVFMTATPNIRVKLYILSKMKENGLMQRLKTVRMVCRYLIPYEIDSSLESSQTHEEFLQHMDSRYGPLWLTATGGNRILNALAEKGLISRCWEFMRVMESRDVIPTTTSISTILNHCKYSINVKGAIEILKDLPTSIPLELDDMTYNILFELAWRYKGYNLARVVWRYACLHARTTHTMRWRVVRSIMNTEIFPNTGTNSYQRWKQQVGYFILGSTDPDRSSLPTFRRALKSGKTAFKHTIPMLYKSKFATLRSLEAQFRKLNLAFGHWAPVRPLHEMLEEAFELDKTWKSLGAPERTKKNLWKNSLTLRWKLKRGIAIQIQDKLKSRSVVRQWK